MSRTTLLLALLPTLGAQVPWWTTGFDDAVARAKLRNVPLLIAINVDGEEANERAAEFYRTPEFVALAERCVPIVASVGAHEEGSGRSGSAVCGRFGSVSCGAHRSLESRVRRQFFGGPEVPIPAPHHLLVRPDLQVVWRDSGDLPAIANLQSEVGKLQSVLGRGLSEAQIVEVEGCRERVAEARRLGQPMDALKDIATLQALGEGTPFAAEWRRLEESLTSEVESAFVALEARLADGDALTVLRTLNDWAPRLRGTPFERRGKKLSSDVRTTSAGRNAVKVLEREARALPFLELAKAAEREGEWAKAVRNYEAITMRAPGTPLAERATARVRELEEDKDLGPVLREDRRRREAEDALTRAKRLAKDSPADGRAALKKIADDYPGTPAAATAEKLLGGRG